MHEEPQQKEQLPPVKIHDDQQQQPQEQQEYEQPMPLPVESQLASTATTTNTTNNGGSFPSDNFNSTQTLAQPGYANTALPPSTVVNLSNSTDVVIGPMTQYQGPVNIYYMDASMQTAAGISSATNSNNNHNNNYSSLDSDSVSVDTDLKRRTFTRNMLLRVCLILCLLVLLVLSTAIIIVFVKMNSEQGVSGGGGDRAINFGNNLEDGMFPNIGNGHLIINREQWGASELTGKLYIPLVPPVPYVLITHVGVQSIPCNTIYKCSVKMRTIQYQDIVEKGLPDLQSNFYVSDEGHIYVGRGWDYANSYANNSLAITFLGDYTRYRTTKKQLEGVQYLLAHGVTNRKLDNDYKLVAHNQTKITESPGSNVYSEIKDWAHFYPCGMNKKSICGRELGMTAESWIAGQ